jgi:hypothetical protein
VLDTLTSLQNLDLSNWERLTNLSAWLA